MNDETQAIEEAAERIRAEAHKLRAEADKLESENRKFAAEQRKLELEGDALHRWRYSAIPAGLALVLAALFTAVGALFARVYGS